MFKIATMELDKSGSNLFELLLVSHQRPAGGGRLFNLMEATPTSSVRSTKEIEWGHPNHENKSDGYKIVQKVTPKDKRGNFF